ncbi:MAG: N-acetylglucosamine-6-phosphate deacetylase, partial [Chthoniobacterales bacterium]
MKVIARDFLTGTPYEYLIEEGLFRAIRPADSSHPEKLPWIAPGLYDVQVNGFGGVDFNNPISKDDWLKACSALATHGCTHFLATLITNNQENYRSLLTGIEKLRDEEDGCRGYHMEGPFLNPDPGTHGAHNTSWMCAANLTWLKEWQSISKNNIRLVTIAPEIAPEKSLEFIRQAVAQEIRISLGHSVATGEILKQAVDA